MELHDVVMRLVGPVNPVGETNTDNERFENLKKLTELTDRLVYVIDEIARSRGSSEYSVARAGKHCSSFLDSLGIVE